jgi:hypothetical protein
MAVMIEIAIFYPIFLHFHSETHGRHYRNCRLL